MSFDWKSLGGLLAKQGLPILANAIIPGSGTVVALITNALGLSHDASPQDIATAINSNPDNIVKLKELQDKHEEAIVQISTAAEVAAIQAVNTTLQTDARGDSWIQKNHHAIESLIVTNLVVCIYFILPLLKLPVPTVPEFAFLMLGAILGVTSWQHGQVNRAIAEGQKE